MSFVNKNLLEPGCPVILHHKYRAIVGVPDEDADPMLNVMKLEKAPKVGVSDAA